MSLARTGHSSPAALPHSTNAHHHELRMCNTPCTPTDLHEQWRPSAGCNRGRPPLRVRPRAPRPPAAAPAARQIRRQAQQPAARRGRQEPRWRQAKVLGGVLGGGQEAQTCPREKRGAPVQTPPVPQNQRVQTNRSPLTTSLLTAHHTPLLTTTFHHQHCAHRQSAHRLAICRRCRRQPPRRSFTTQTTCWFGGRTALCPSTPPLAWRAW